MTVTKTYWMDDGHGTKARFAGVEERDRWVPLGWSESDEPTPGDQVWLRHADHGGHARFPAEAVELWQHKGWRPAAPPDPGGPLGDATPADAPGQAAGTDSTAPTASAKTKEK